MHNSYKVDLTKEFNATPAALYDAWVQPDQLKQWWKPINKQLIEVTDELKKDGLIKYVFEDNSLNIEGSYLEIKDNEKLVHTWNWQLPKDDIKDSKYKLTVEFSEKKDGNAALHVIQENFEDEEGTVPHKQGWMKGLADLENYSKGKQE